MSATSSQQDYAAFLHRRAQNADQHGFEPRHVPSFLFGFQQHLVEWSVRKGRAALLCDCGLGKTPMALVWSQNVVEHTNGRVLIATPLAVAFQIVREAEKFGIPATRATTKADVGGPGIYVTNYERLHHFDAAQFAGMVCDESSILKNFDGVRRQLVTEFLRGMRYRLLATATAAPNDYVELGTSSEALGELGHMDMLMRFFKNEQNALHANRNWGDGGKWRFKRHAQQPFWRWVCSWARAVRKPSDIGFDNGRFVLPPLDEREHIVRTRTKRPGFLFETPAETLGEQRDERRRTIAERCEMVAQLAAHDQPVLVWCHLNEEGDALERLIPGAIQVAGRDDEDAKESKLVAFASGDARVLITKPKIGAWGLNLQHCAHVIEFPSHSYEQHYQGVRRCWRFGQQRPVVVDIIATEGERGVLENLKRKAAQADQMFSQMVEHMGDALRLTRSNPFTKNMEAPKWLSSTN